MKTRASISVLAVLLVLIVMEPSGAIGAAASLNPGSPQVGIEVTFVPPPQPGDILLLDDGGEPGQEGRQALDIFGYSYTQVSAAGLATTDLDAFDVIFVAWYPTQEMVDALNARKADLEGWIGRGGGIVVNAEWKGPPGVTNPYSFLPVTFDTDAGWHHTNGVHIVDTAHPLADGLTDALLDSWGNSVHGKITTWPPDATVVTVATAFDDSPHVIGMCYRAGKIVVAASDPEFHVVYGPGDGPRILLSNELSWAAVPCCVRGASVEITPETFNLDRKGRWITARITPPAGYDAEDITGAKIVWVDLLPCEIEGEIVSPMPKAAVVKFDSAAVGALLPIPEGGPAGKGKPGRIEDVEICVVAALSDGLQTCETCDTIDVIGGQAGE